MKTIGAVIFLMALFGVLVLGCLAVHGENLELRRVVDICKPDLEQAQINLKAEKSYTTHLERAIFNCLINSADYCLEEQEKNTNQEWIPFEVER